ncbi:MAG: BlaI/MecI/CopY family transcriptional regulator [Planctomycetes bacterium]|nr:BlaI/MecI/CopY family transcriptional regulator [Planctomycetota bacterium]
MRRFRDATQAEQTVLEALWDLETATIRQLTDRLYPNGTASNFSSVQKLLERLEAKGFVRRERTGSVHVFHALVDRQELVGRRLKAVAESLCDGSLTALVEHLIEAHDLTPDDRRSLQELIDNWADKKEAGRKRN